jgi:hypothetical protein
VEGTAVGASVDGTGGTGVAAGGTEVAAGGGDVAAGDTAVAGSVESDPQPIRANTPIATAKPMIIDLNR